MDINILWKVVERPSEHFNDKGGFNIVTYDTYHTIMTTDFSFGVAQQICEAHNRCIFSLMGVNDVNISK